jgi:hypothetical protein
MKKGNIAGKRRLIEKKKKLQSSPKARRKKIYNFNIKR